MKKFKWTVRDEYGLHARPVGLLVKIAGKFPCKITIAKDTKSADGKKLFSVMGLAVTKGETVEFSFDGENEDQACQEIKAFCEGNL
jgi:Phosphotransferase System HPr (HPr) Family